MNVSHWKVIQRKNKPLALQQAWDLYLISDEETATSCFERKKVNSTVGIELFHPLCCIHIGHCIISIIRLKAIQEVPVFVSAALANKKLWRSSFGLCYNTLSSCTRYCFYLSVAVRTGKHCSDPCVLCQAVQLFIYEDVWFMKDTSCE